MDNEFRNHINTIISANRNKMLALFIGAGISRTSDTPSNKLPDWAKLIEKLKNELNEAKEHDFLKIAQLYFLTFKEYKYYNTVKSFFPDTIEPSIIHEMIFDLNPEIIITTNWDTILENAIKKQGYLYDVVSSDAELVKSTLPKKLIKMHGDFNHQNFVFKEDDYIEYSDNFPLIENYIKGILSTHTVVFLGYSYNDMDIKHIIKWIQSRSDCRPPMFLTEFSENLSQKRYLENFGITTLVLKDEIDSLSNTNNPYTKSMQWFLDILNSKDFVYELSTNEGVIQYIYEKLIVLNDLQNIIFTQIESFFNYSKVTFGNGLPILVFLYGVPPKDKEKGITDIYRQFIEATKNMKCKDDPKYIIENEKLNAIFVILSRAGIKGILLNMYEDEKEENMDLGNCFVLYEPGLFENIIGFNFSETASDLVDPLMKMTDSAFILYQQEQYEKILPLLDEIIVECRSRRRWTLLFIAMLNKNVILRRLKYYHFLDKYALIKEYDLAEEYKKLPEEIKIAVAPIYDFLQFNELYKLFFSLSRDLTEKEDHNKTIIKGGMVFGSDGRKNSQQQENLLRFVIGNKIMIENYSDYRDIHRKILLIRLTEQALSNKIEMNHIELYTAIKYLDSKSLKELFKDFSPDIEKDIRKELILVDEDKKWLVDTVFTNISDQYINTKNVSSSIENYLVNTLFIMSLIKFSESELDFILERINSIIAHPGNVISIYEGIEIFLGLQYNLFLPNFDGELFVKIIGSVIRKIIRRELNMYERYSITINGLSNIFGYARQQKAIFTDEKAIRQIVLEISDFNETEKKQIISSILLNIFLIGTDKIKEIIKEYVLSVDNIIDIDDKIKSREDSQGGMSKDVENKMNINGKILYELNLDLVGIKELEINVIGKIEEYLTRYEAATYFDGYAVTIIKLVISMYERKKNDNMQSLYNKAKSIAENKDKMTLSFYKKNKRENC